MIDCTAQWGGAIAVLTGGAVEITRSFVKACVATDGGGGVFVGGAGSFKATDSSFVGCACLDGDGGALLITAGLVSISGGHTGQCVAQHGGAMHAQGGQLEVYNHLFNACSASQDGGVLLVDHVTTGAYATLTSCTIVNARSGVFGGVVFILKGVATVKRCVVQGASALWGSSYAVYGGTLNILDTNDIDDLSCSANDIPCSTNSIINLDIGDAYIRGCNFSRASASQGVNFIIQQSGTLRIAASTIRNFWSFAALHKPVLQLEGGSSNLQDVQILNCSMPTASSGIIHVKKPAVLRAEVLLVELDCIGSVAIWSEDPERALDVVGLSLLPSECTTSPQAAQVSNAKFSGCSDPSACGVAAECTDELVLLDIPSLTNPECSCTGVNYPMPSAASAALAPYVRGPSGGCATPRQAERVFVVGETVGTVVIELHKGGSIDALSAENITLATAMTGSGISLATWTSAVRYLPKTVPAWVQLQLGGGLIPAGAEQMRLWIVATSSGLAERSEVYQAHLDLSVMSQNNVTLTVPIFLSVSASTTAAAWGTVLENGRCAETVDAATSMTHSLDDQIDLHFVACDVEMLPVQHRLPTVDDPREFSITVRHAGGEAREGVDYRVTMGVASPGKYVVQLTLLHLAKFTVQLVLADEPVARPLSITTECPKGRVPHGVECGCAQGTVYNSDTAVCEACPPNTFSNQTLPTDEQLACTPCPKHSVSPAASTSAAICLASEGFYARTHDGLVHGEGDCVRCPAGTACETAGHSTQTLPLLTGWWRASNTSVDVKRCADHDADEGSGCVGGPDAWSCKEKLSGPLCVLCKDGPGHYCD